MVNVERRTVGIAVDKTAFSDTRPAHVHLIVQWVSVTMRIVVNTGILKQFVMLGKATGNANMEIIAGIDILIMRLPFKIRTLFYGEATRKPIGTQIKFTDPIKTEDFECKG